ncbi:MAG: 5-demethoxyubiquinol-8 5-hydroxylase UbiM [Pseudomonadota bacterium]|nr:5-demethoxyubiquinol-8 5-hydroxylase UbiM [Pseudomonadota bacterium]
MTASYDIVVAGAGPVGLAFAASLADTGLSIALVDPQPAAALADPADDGREIALTDRSVALLTGLGAWDRIPADAIAPLRRMQVLNGPSTYAMHLGTGESLGRFAPNHWLRRALHAVAQGCPNVTILPGRSVAGLRVRRDSVEAAISGDETISASLVIAADTRRSRLRELQGIGVTLHDYRQRMLVCPMTHTVPHRETATAWFEYGQTLCTLPLNHGCSSAVMTVSEPDAAGLLALDDVDFGREVTRRYRGRLGDMAPAGKRHAVPVVTTYARRFVARRFALMGDAAVGMHPTTAHGFNFGMLGQHALAKQIRAAHTAGRDVADPAALSRYEAAHRSETRLFYTGAEAIMRLYAAGDSLPARLLRNGALRLGNLPPFRNVLAARMRDPDAHNSR